jgi:hypothetical protein
MQLDHVTLLVSSLARSMPCYDRLPDVQDLGGAIALFMKDPDGIRFEVTWYPPGVVVVG